MRLQLFLSAVLAVLTFAWANLLQLVIVKGLDTLVAIEPVLPECAPEPRADFVGAALDMAVLPCIRIIIPAVEVLSVLASDYPAIARSDELYLLLLAWSIACIKEVRVRCCDLLLLLFTFFTRCVLIQFLSRVTLMRSSGDDRFLLFLIRFLSGKASSFPH